MSSQLETANKAKVSCFSLLDMNIINRFTVQVTTALTSYLYLRFLHSHNRKIFVITAKNAEFVLIYLK